MILLMSMLPPINCTLQILLNYMFEFVFLFVSNQEGKGSSISYKPGHTLTLSPNQ